MTRRQFVLRRSLQRWSGRFYGFSMVEMVAVMALLALAAALVGPAFNPSTGKTDLQALALETAALLRTTRLTALSKQADQSFFLDSNRRLMGSSIEDSPVIVLPDDVEVRHEVSSRCRQSAGVVEVIILKDGRTCGSQITLAIQGYSAIIQTNWLVGKTSVRFEG